MNMFTNTKINNDNNINNRKNILNEKTKSNLQTNPHVKTLCPPHDQQLYCFDSSR